jgi:hypothetical protein
MTGEERDSFIQELHDLLEKYNVEISIGLDGDTHGLDSWIDVDHRVGKSFKYEKIFQTNGEITVQELKQIMKSKSENK